MKRENNEQKYRRLAQLGKLFVQRECQFAYAERGELNTPTKIPRILLNQTETHDTLLEAIRNEQVFGFARVKVDFPSHIKNKASRQGFLFPPIVRHLTLEERHLSSAARQQWEREGRPPLPSPTIVQTYTTQDQLIMSSTLSYYMRELGAQVKIHQFFQFVGEKCFTPFCERVIDCRKRSKREDNPSAGNTAKLVGNSAYGKTIGSCLLLSYIFFL